MHAKGSIDKDSVRFLKEQKLRLECGHFYLLSKILEIQDNVWNALYVAADGNPTDGHLLLNAIM